MLDDSITGRKIEDRHEKMNKESDVPEEPEYNGDSVQINVDQQSYGEQSSTDDIDNVNKDCDQGIAKVRLIVEQTHSMIKSYNEPDQSTASQNDIPDE